MNRREQASALLERLRRSYCKPGEKYPGVVFVTEVNAPEGNRRADALALHLTKARPWIDGIEIKVDRSDWLDELDQHTKADAWFGYTHRWWVAVPDPAIVDRAELPDGWGLMVPDPRSDRRMKPVVKPAVRTPSLSYGAVVEVLKKLDTQRAEQVEDQVRHERARLQAEFDQRAKNLRYPEDRLARLERDAGRALADATKLPLRTIQQQLTDPHTVALVRAALEPGAETGQDKRLCDHVTREARRHQETATALAAAAAALTGQHDMAQQESPAS